MSSALALDHMHTTVCHFGSSACFFIVCILCVVMAHGFDWDGLEAAERALSQKEGVPREGRAARLCFSLVTSFFRRPFQE